MTKVMSKTKCTYIPSIPDKDFFTASSQLTHVILTANSICKGLKTS